MRLLISNLNRFTTASQLVNLLHPFGLVSEARIVINAQNGYSEGMALVEIEYKAGQIVISELNNSRFMNYYISVEETIPANNSSSVKGHRIVA
ncbi:MULTISPECIES: RNA recognition motif domain-containing protein [Niastella]|uniref:RNA-binding protein n=1 Tax=Niastella soli TaxID=2821487 RepID=A0ABS3YXB5_9BACT|nr:RNA-binding protein [Niastella soli]MBO9202060.1 RNA-binding protein [Niastella soli]